jgi:hypothetical protein
MNHSGLAALSDDARRRLLERFDAQAERCRAKNYNEEGIPMFLVLEDMVLEDVRGDGTRQPGASSDPLYDALLAAALELFAEHVASAKGTLEPKDVSVILEVMAETYFVPPGPASEA